MSSAITYSTSRGDPTTGSEMLPPAIMDALLSMIWRLEARLEASEQRLAMTNTTPRPEPEFDPILGRPLTSWDLQRPRIDLDLCSNRSDWNYSQPCVFDPPQQPAYSESYRGGGWYSYNNYESQAWSYNNYESQVRSYNTSEPDRYNNYESQVQYEPPLPAQNYTYESDRYNYVPQPVRYEPPPPAHYYSVAELPPQQHYYPPPPSYTRAPDVDATLETDVNESEDRMDARQDEIAGDPLLEEISEDESTPMVDPKLEVAEADAGYEQQLSELQTDPHAAERVLDEMMKPIDDQQTVVNNRNKALILIESWGESSNELRYLLFCEETRKSLKSRGVRFAVRDEERLAPIFAPASYVEVSQPKVTLGLQIHFDGNGPMLSPMPSSAKFRKGGVDDFAYEKRAISNRHAAGGNTSRVPFTQPGRSWRNEDQRNVGFAENGNGSYGRKLSFGSRRLVIFGIYALEEVYKDLLNLHLEDKVILKGGGVDTDIFILIIYICHWA